MRIDVLYPSRPPGSFDGVGDYSRCLVAALKDEGHDAQLTSAASADAELVLLQYTPFSWGRRGLAPSLLRYLASLRRRSPKLRVAIMVHEPYMTDGRFRHRALGRAQRAQLAALRGLSDVTIASIEPWRDLLEDAWPKRPVAHVPVGSNLPDRRSDRTESRRRNGIGSDEIVLAAFDSSHPGRSRALLGSTVRSAREMGASRLLLLGADADPGGLSGLPLICPGRLSDRELAAHLAASDVFLAPFVDGVSTRRTTVVAALQHGLPVVGTYGHLTDRSLVGPGLGLQLAHVDDADAFVDAAAFVVGDVVRRSRLGNEARALFDTRFAWPRLTEQLLAAVAM